MATTVISISTYGASTGASAATNNTAIQNALNQKGSIYFPEGVFNVTGNLTISSDTHLFGPGTLKLNASTGAGVSILSIATGITNITINGLTLDGSKITNTTQFGLINLNGSTNVEITNTKTINSGYHGINVDHASFTMISECRVLDFLHGGINVTYSYNNIFNANYIDGKTETSLPTMGEHGIQVWGNFNGSLIAGDHVISNNIVRNVSGGGIWGAGIQNMSITGNIVQTCGDVGIDVEIALYCTITGNTIKNCTNGCITLFYASKFITISGNNVYQDTGYGVGIHFHGEGISEKVSVTGNVINTKNSFGIYCDAQTLTDSVLSSNNIISQAEMGIRVLQCSSIKIIGNDILVGTANGGNYNKGITIEGGSECVVENNSIKTLSDNSTVPGDIGGVLLYWISSTFSAKRNIVRNNRIEGFKISINDDCWGDHASASLIVGNSAQYIYYRGPSGYTGYISDNRNISSPTSSITAVAY